MKKSRYAPPENKLRENDLNDKQVEPIEEEEFDEKQPEQVQEPPEKDLQFMLGNSICVDDPKDLDSQNVTTLEEFILSLSADIAQELFKLMRKVSEYNVTDMKQIFFVFAVLKCEKIISELLFKLFKSKLRDLMRSEFFIYSEGARDLIKKDKKMVFDILNSCLNEKLENVATEIMKLSMFCTIEDELLKKAMDFEYFKFLFTLLANTKAYFKKQLNSSLSSKASRYSQAQAYKNIFTTAISLKIPRMNTNDSEDIDFWTEHERANDYIQKCLIKGQEKCAIKLLLFYYMKFNRNFVKYSIIDYAVLNKSFYFVKKYFDIYPRTRYKIKDFECITYIIDILDDKENFMHGIFLLSKVNLLCLNEVYIRLIIDKYQNFIKFKLMLITYSLNPILVCVMIIQNLKRFENNYANLRIKIKTICDEYLNLAKGILTMINDDTILKTIFLKNFYPSQVSLLKILYEDRNYFVPILQNEILFNIVTDLWYCEYYWTPNFMNSSSALKNLISHYGSKDLHINPLEERFFMNKMIDNNVFETDTNEEEDEGKDDIDSTPMNYLLFHKNIKGEYTTCTQKEIDLHHPFFFYQKTKFSREIRYTNHIFSYYFFEKSPLFKVSFEILSYSLISLIILINVFDIFRIRRDFDECPREILRLSDGLSDLEVGLPPSDRFNWILKNYTVHLGTNNDTQTYQMLAASSLEQICVNIFPWFTGECVQFAADAHQIIDTKKYFWILQLFYYLVFLQSLLEIIFVYKVSKKIQITSKNWIDICLCILNIYIHAYYFTYLHDTYYLLKNDELTEYRKMEEMIAVFIFLIWIKFITYMKLIKQFGTIIKVIEVMVTNLMSFFVILGIIILAFASICFNLFDQYNPQQYGTFWVTLRTLVLYMFGQVDFFHFTDQFALAALLVNIYEIITFVLMLNLLIAILSNTFNSYNQKSNLQNASVLYNDYLSKKPDKFYSALTGISPPFNIYLIVAAPILLFKKSSKLNKVCVFIGFFMYSIIFLAIYIVLNLALVIPLCYVRLSITIPTNLIGIQNQKKGVWIWLIWLFLGPFYMVWIFLKHDCLLFIRSMFYSCSMKDKLDEITKEEIMLVYQKAEEQLKNGNEYLTYHELVACVKDGIEEINRKFRKHSIQTKNSNWNIVENLQKKTAKIIGVNLGPEPEAKEKDRADLSEKIENKINVFVEIDKMEVFSFLRQFVGINGKINLEKLKFLINQIKFCKKFHLITLSMAKRNKLIKVIQVNQMLAVEKSVINMMAEQVRNSKIFDKVLKKFIC